ncbi:MAG: hypothetical protein DA408_11120 [Bacteroidetes bacterium]|nr:MAG: hypothetical protein C7N36_19320 [Bacteroidota bacterium]PTM12319.1 MAG: hypothetical protein DA408_11120 [Bacteroidota bacterium]
MKTTPRFVPVIPSLLLVFFMLSCSPEGHVKGWQPLDLLPYGVPVSVLAPPEAAVKIGRLNSALLKDLTIEGGADYNIQLFYSPAVTNDIARLKNDLLQNVRANRYFRKIVSEEVAGFIYQSMIDSTASYGFRFVKLQGDLELNFQTGMSHLFSLEDAQLMYEAVK